MNTMVTKFRNMFFHHLGQFLLDHGTPYGNGTIFGTFVSKLVHAASYERSMEQCINIEIFFKDTIYCRLFLTYLETVFHVKYSTKTKNILFGTEHIDIVLRPIFHGLRPTVALNISIISTCDAVLMLPYCDIHCLQIGHLGKIERFNRFVQFYSLDDIVLNIAANECNLIILSNERYNELYPNKSYEEYWRFVFRVYYPQLIEQEWNVRNVKAYSVCMCNSQHHMYLSSDGYIVTVCSCCRKSQIIFSDFKN